MTKGSKVGLGLGIVLAIGVVITLIGILLYRSGIFKRDDPYAVYHNRSNSYSSTREVTA